MKRGRARSGAPDHSSQAWALSMDAPERAEMRKDRFKTRVRCVPQCLVDILPRTLLAFVQRALWLRTPERAPLLHARSGARGHSSVSSVDAPKRAKMLKHILSSRASSIPTRAAGLK